MPRTLVTRLLVGLAGVLLIAGCTTDEDSGAADPTEADGTDEAQVEISTFAFSPATVTASSGTTVVWTNRDDTVHTVTSGTPEDPDGSFDGSMGRGETFSHSFDEPGTYEYFCAKHPSMRAEIRIS